ncbi:MAG TPA: hypothetical protein VMV97_12280 [Sulfuriferula sp.]|nr:hypothetical protein [Sulfuriferula sp.]
MSKLSGNAGFLPFVRFFGKPVCVARLCAFAENARKTARKKRCLMATLSTKAATQTR